MCPHFNQREEDFLRAMKSADIKECFCVENDCAIEFVDGKFTKSISSGGRAYLIKNDSGQIVREEL